MPPTAGFSHVCTTPVSILSTQVEHYEQDASGLNVFLAPISGPICSFAIVVPTKAIGNSGLPHVLEHLVFMGSKKYPTRGYLDTLALSCGGGGGGFLFFCLGFGFFFFKIFLFLLSGYSYPPPPPPSQQKKHSFTPLVLSVNRVDLGFFCFINFPISPPPRQQKSLFYFPQDARPRVQMPIPLTTTRPSRSVVLERKVWGGGCWAF